MVSGVKYHLVSYWQYGRSVTNFNAFYILIKGDGNIESTCI